MIVLALYIQSTEQNRFESVVAGFVRTELANKREEQEAETLAKLRAKFPEDMQQLYPNVFSEQARTAKMDGAKQAFAGSPTAAQTTTPGEKSEQLFFSSTPIQPNSTTPHSATALPK